MPSPIALYRSTPKEQIKNVFKDMLQRQEKVNSRLSNKWVSKALNGEWDYLFAGVEELVELAKCLKFEDRIGYKWWSKEQDVNSAKLNAIMELVDAWHFFMSEDITRYNLDYLSTSYTEEYLEAKAMMKESKNDGDKLSPMAILKDIVSSCTGDGGFSSFAFFLLCQVCDVDYRMLYSIYVAKAELNIFRQDHGYKEGTYIKTWQKRSDTGIVLSSGEDNHYLMEWLMLKLQSKEKEVTDIQIRAFLENSYRNVLQMFGIQDVTEPQKC